MRKDGTIVKGLSKKVAQAEASQTLALTALAKKLKAEGVDVVSLTAGEPDFPTPRHIKDAAVRAIEEDFTKYTVNTGIPELRSAIAAKLKRDNGVAVDPSQIVVSNGAKHSIFNALQAIVNRGDEVIIPAPYWVSYPEMVKLVDGVPVILKTTEKSDFKISPAQLKKAVTKRTKALILAFGSSVHAFTLVVTTFILGLGLGGLLASLARTSGTRLLLLLAGLEAAVGLSAGAGIRLLADLPLDVILETPGLAGDYDALLRWQFLHALRVVLLPTLLMGAAFPVLVAAVAGTGGEASRSVGRVYGWNTGGTILGSLLGGLLLVPAAGIRGASPA
ncbi:MAG: aminotransferase class I/II-fold pyridoxal phosphate-dependent enzyme [Planctomycetaceae bacterium]|nr:aminotransferase class I/II-fold pyridoxal phosphate-dependent enzyme [Planctomycetaceae bacterium]